MLLSAEHLSINFGSRQLLDDVNFYLNEGDKVGVIGINGTGKSTFLKVLAGVAEPDGRHHHPESQRAGESAWPRTRPWRIAPPCWSRSSSTTPPSSGS